VLRRDLLAFRRLGVAQQEGLQRLGRLYPSVWAYPADVADNHCEAVDTAASCDYIDGAIKRSEYDAICARASESGG
jgi:hypothetical protein